MARFVPSLNMLQLFTSKIYLDESESEENVEDASLAVEFAEDIQGEAP